MVSVGAKQIRIDPWVPLPGISVQVYLFGAVDCAEVQRGILTLPERGLFLPARSDRIKVPLRRGGFGTGLETRFPEGFSSVLHRKQGNA